MVLCILYLEIHIGMVDLYRTTADLYLLTTLIIHIILVELLVNNPTTFTRMHSMITFTYQEENTSLQRARNRLTFSTFRVRTRRS